MATDRQTAIALVRAIENGHIALEENATSVLESTLLSNDAVLQKNRRKSLELMIVELDSSVNQIDVLTLFSSTVH